MVFLRGAMRRWAHDVAHDAQEMLRRRRVDTDATLAKDAPQTGGTMRLLELGMRHPTSHVRQTRVR